MNYTQAVLLEILRYSCKVTMTSHAPLEDTHLRADSIPKVINLQMRKQAWTLISYRTQGSMCSINLYAIHRSEDLWTEPHDCRPERFLGEGGGITNAEKIIPFGFGMF